MKIDRSYKRVYWTVAREMGPDEIYVDTRESHHYDTRKEAQIDADARNVVLVASIVAGNDIMNPDAKFMPVKITTINLIQSA